MVPCAFGLRVLDYYMMNGERDEKNPLQWDKIDATYYTKWNGFKNFTERIGQSVENLNNHIISTLGKVLNKIGEEEMLLLKSLLDPCAYLLPYGCPLLVSSLAGTLESAFAEEEIEEEAEFDAMCNGAVGASVSMPINPFEPSIVIPFLPPTVNLKSIPLVTDITA
mgnify:CR=1 FL=1